MLVRWLCFLLFALCSLGFFPAIGVRVVAAEAKGVASSQKPPSDVKASASVPTEIVMPPGLSPEGIARNVCSVCHVFPPPDLLDRETWKKETLPRMMIRMGLAPQSVDAHPEAALIKATGKIPEQPIIPMAIFDQIEAYYLSQAPAQPLPQDRKDEVDVGLRGFELVRPQLRRRPAAVTMVKINESDHRLYVGDATARTLEYFSPSGDYIGGLQVSNAPVALTETPQGLFVSMIGDFYPSEKRNGAFVQFVRQGNQLEKKRVLLDQLPRTVDAQFADLNGDGKLDFVLCVFGNMVGRFSWFENLGNDDYREHVLLDKPGAVKCVVRDFNGDQRPDVAVLVAQDTEALLIYENQGGGVFKSREVFRQHPLYGHTGFEVIDFNADGRPDFLVTNGDNGEYPSPLKKYHGIRVYQNQGNNDYGVSFFYPLNGAFKAVARDFDQDGDLDIAAISFFPDYESSPEESFVYLENGGNGKYRPATFRECISGRWLSMDVGDLDGDGDLDIALGSYIRGPSKVPDFLRKDWEQSGSSFLILKNRLR